MASNPLTAELHVVPVLILRYEILTVYSFWSTADFIAGGLTSQALGRTASTGYRLQTTFVVKTIKDIWYLIVPSVHRRSGFSLQWLLSKRNCISLENPPHNISSAGWIHVCFWSLAWFVLHCDQMKIETYPVTMAMLLCGCAHAHACTHMHALGFESTLNVEEREPSRSKLQ